VAADKSDEPGVLGNLPRSRPGQRSEKRKSSTTARAKAAPSSRAQPARAKTSGKATAGGKPPRSRAKPTAARARKPAKPKPAPAATRPPSTPPPTPRPEREPERRAASDPLSGAVRLAGKVAEVGLKTAGGLIKRLPGR
jgi:hypothetical protein